MELAFFFLHISRAQCLAPTRTRTHVVWLGAQCTDHWTTEQSCGDGMPAVQLTMHVKSSTLYGRMVVWSYGHTVVWSYIQIFSAWWVTTILYNYGLCSASSTIIKHNSNAFKLLMKISSSKKFPHVIASMAIICARILFQGDGGRLEQVLDD